MVCLGDVKSLPGYVMVDQLSQCLQPACNVFQGNGLQFGPALRKVLYTTNAIESFNREMRKVLKTRTQFPNDDSVAKTLWLAILDAEEKRAEQRARQAGKPRAHRDAVPRLIEGHVTQGWREAWGEVVAAWPERFADRA